MLTEEQRRAVEVIDRPLSVIAGPGTGKTKVITEKIAYLIREKGYSSDSLLALTFTEKAASEMAQRVELLTDEPFEAKTFHAFARELVEEFQDKIPSVDEGFTVIDEADQLLYFYELMESFSFASIEVQNNKSRVASALQGTISQLKDFGYRLRDLPQLEFSDVHTKTDLMSAYARYEKYKQKEGFLDFGDLLLLLQDLLNNTEVAEELRQRFRYLVVDEFQDTNKVQLSVLSTLSTEQNITVVGDSKQAIYGFRGAHFASFSDFKERFRDVEEVYLHDNFRSQKEVLGTVNALIPRLTQPEEQLRPQEQGEGSVSLITCSTDETQLQYLVSTIQQARAQGKDIGVLTRRKSELFQISSLLTKAGIAHTVVQMESFFEKPIIQEVLSLLRIIENPRESNQELFALMEQRGVRKETLQSINRKAKRQENSLYNVLFQSESLSEFADEKPFFTQFVEALDQVSRIREAKSGLSTMIREILSSFHISQRLEYAGDHQQLFALSSFLQFVDRFVTTYKTHNLSRFLEVCDLSLQLNITSMPESEQKPVQLMTYHQAKGKEFDEVCLPFLNARRFPAPFRRPLFPLPFGMNRHESLDEELRLFFVGLSRAREALHLLTVRRYGDNKMDSKPSEFLQYLSHLRNQEYDTPLQLTQQRTKEQVQQEILSRLTNHLLNHQFARAREDVNLFERLFSSKRKDLTSYVRDQTSSLVDEYQKQLSKEDITNVPVNPKEMVYSVSQLQTYETCPKKYLYQYIYKIPTQPRHFFDFGSSMHKVLELLLPCFGQDGMSKELLYVKGMELLREHWISRSYESVEQEQQYYQKATDAIAQFVERELSLREDPQRKTVYREEKFVLHLDGRRVIGFIDRIDATSEGYEILDYKTSMSQETEEQLKDNIQLYVYAEALPYQFKLAPERVGLWYLVYDSIVSVRVGDANKQEIRERIDNLIKGIEEGEFRATPSHKACRMCDFKRICRDAKK